MKHPVHQGQAVERVIRSKGYSATEFAKLAKVNRRFLFIWFNQPILKPQTLQIISRVINHDFSVEFFGPRPDHKPVLKIAARRKSKLVTC